MNRNSWRCVLEGNIVLFFSHCGFFDLLRCLLGFGVAYIYCVYFHLEQLGNVAKHGLRLTYCSTSTAWPLKAER